MEKIEDICISSITDIISSMASDPSPYAMNPEKDFTRNRILPFDKLLWGIMAMEGNSPNKELFDIFNNTSEKKPFVSKSVFVQQRNKLKHEAFQKMFNDFNKTTSVYDAERFNGYRLLAVDGSDVNIALNPDSDTYFAPECNKSEKGFNQFHLNAMFDILNCVYTDAVVQPGPKEHEVEAARIMIKRFQPDDKNIVLADRGYASLDLMATIRDMGADFLFRVPNGFLVELKNMPMTDFDVDLEFTIVTDQNKETRKLIKEGKVKWLPGPSKFGKPKKTVTWFHLSPYLMKLRVVRFQLETGDYETIVTSLSREEFSPDLIKELYHKR